MARCPDCGSETFQEAIFCHNCGARLGIGSAPSDQGQVENRAPPPYPGTYAAPSIKPRKRARTAIATVIAVVVVVAIVWTAASEGWIGFHLNQNTGDTGPTPHNGNYTISYSWTYGGREWRFSENISAATYDSYHDRARSNEYTDFVTKSDPVVEGIALWLDNAAKNESYDPAQFVLSFVQNIEYGTDQNTTGHAYYPRYSVETLVDAIGDCKSHSILFVSLMGSPEFNASVSLLVLMPPQFGDVGHMAGGLAMPGYSGTYFTEAGKDYFYCETTSSGWLIGEEPDQVADFSVQVLPV